MPSALSPSRSTSSPPASGRRLSLDFGPGVSRFLSLATDPTGTTNEVAAFGTRGDGKTIGALAAMVIHAQYHRAAGGALPTRWLGAADTFASHTAKTHPSLLNPLWLGTWQLRDGGHLAAFHVDGVDLVHLRLLGVEDQQGMDRLRAECHGLWFEEPAPVSVMIQSSGLSETAWAVGITSCRLPSYRNPKIMTLNYPDQDHWTYRRFVEEPQPGTAVVRIPRGDNAHVTAAMRDEWMRALSTRPDLQRRLLLGEPGLILEGQPVARGWAPELHVADTALAPVQWTPLWLGHDAGHTPSTIIGQRVDGQLRIYAGLVTEHVGTRQHVEQTLLPWLQAHAPWALRRGTGEEPACYHAYDPSMDTGDQSDTDSSPVRVLRDLVGGTFRPGAITWEGRRDPMLAAFNLGVSGRPALRVSPGPDTRLLRKALDGRWHYPTKVTGEVRSIQPAKPNPPWADLGDAWCYLIGGLAPHKAIQPERHRSYLATTAFNPLTHNRPAGDRDFAKRYAHLLR